MAGTRADLPMPHFACGQCGAGLAFAEGVSERCPYCASPNVASRGPAVGRVLPAHVVAFATDASEARRRIAAWLGSRTWFTDARLRGAVVESLRGVYVPAYLYSAVADTMYSASIAEHYSEEEVRTVVSPDGLRTSETRRVTRTEYRPLTGRHVTYVTDVLVSASAGLPDRELHAIEPFELLGLRRFTPAVLAGWIVEDHARDPDDCHRASRRDAVDDVGHELRRFLPGDGHSDLVWQTAIRWESLDPILVPVWVVAVRYRDDRPALRVIVNGQTGAVAGRAPLVWWKLALALGGAALVIAAVALAVARGGGL